MIRDVGPHEAHPPFIRTTQWTKNEHSQWMALRNYCSLCRRPVRLVFGDFLEANEKARWEHDDEHSGHREP